MADSIVTPKEPLSTLAKSREFDFLGEAMLSVLGELMENLMTLEIRRTFEY